MWAFNLQTFLAGNCMYKTNFWLTVTLLFTTPSFSQQPQPVNNTDALPTASTANVEAENYSAEIRDLLQRKKFKEIDQIAEKERSGKVRFAGGGWKLRTLYGALSEFQAGDKTSDVEWNAQIVILKRWIAKDPKSITPHVALADLYINYAWKARGHDYAEKVNDDNWKLFEERASLAKTTLDEAFVLKEKCPQWYNSMQSVALAQGWSKARMAKLFEEAIAFEPAYYYYYYYYYYSQYANYLLPKWYGEEGETEQFADTMSSRIGGKEGSVIYFKIAVSSGCHCSNDNLLQKMSWQKMQQGYDAVTELYGASQLVSNQFAYMAIKMNERC